MTSSSHSEVRPNSSTRPRVKIINDPIHGHFELTDPVLRLIDTPHVQRLRHLKQLGSAYYVYPGASHNRFEHSLGVAHVSGTFVQKLYSNRRDPLARALYDGHHHFQHAHTLIQLAGLAHDLGHGPFSHMFDRVFLPAAIHAPSHHSSLMSHENRSVRMFEHCVDQFNIDLSREDIRVIGQLICGQKSNATLTPRFLYDVVANSTTGIDTDKFDYLARDVYNVGLQGAYGFDYRRLISFAKAVDHNICFHRKEIFSVYHLFLTRFELNRNVYHHHTCYGIDAMVSDAFLHADSHLGISASISDPEDFLSINDSLIGVIERSKHSGLATARNILRRLATRRLYRFVDEVLMPAGAERRSVTPQQITTCQNAAKTGVTLRPEDICVSNVSLNFGMRDQNPVDRVLFFKDWEDTSPKHIPSEQTSYMLPVCFEENIMRIYVKREEHDESNRVKNAVSVAFRNFLRRENLGALLHSPVLSKRDREVLPTMDELDVTASMAPPEQRVTKADSSDM